MRQGCSRSRQVTNTWTECSQVVCSTAFWFTFFSVWKKSQTVGKRYKFTRSSTDPDQSKCAIGVKMPLIIGQNSENPKPLFFFFFVAKKLPNFYPSWYINTRSDTSCETLIQTVLPNMCRGCGRDGNSLAMNLQQPPFSHWCNQTWAWRRLAVWFNCNRNTTLLRTCQRLHQLFDGTISAPYH